MTVPVSGRLLALRHHNARRGPLWICRRLFASKAKSPAPAFATVHNTQVVGDVWENVNAASDIIDARTPSEYNEDHIPGSVNLPTLTDEERHLVGHMYVQECPFKARKHGSELICRNVADHISKYFMDKPSDYRPLVYCWRGGQRSQSLGIILGAIGFKTTVLKGGYRAYRQAVRSYLEDAAPRMRFIAIGGKTGVGKSALLQQLQCLEMDLPVLDFESLACHRGSLLGAMPNVSQPSQKLFESRIVHELRRYNVPQNGNPVWIEAESSKVGSVHIPEGLWSGMRSHTIQMLELEVPIHERVNYLLGEYEEWTHRPEELIVKLRGLTRRHGRKVVEQWTDLIHKAKWDELVYRLLVDHYDPAYERSQFRRFGSSDVPRRRVVMPTVDTQKFALSEAVAAHADAVDIKR